MLIRNAEARHSLVGPVLPSYALRQRCDINMDCVCVEAKIFVLIFVSGAAGMVEVP